MKTEKRDFKVIDLLDAFDQSILTINHEYQRGAKWSTRQKQGFIDSIYRNYPTPSVFLRQKTSQALGKTNETYEIVDGQQRLRALSEYKADKFPLLEVNTPSGLRLPRKVRDQNAPWAGKRYSELDKNLQEQFAQTVINVWLIQTVYDDEVRDLFIRLQAGTALTRQEVRDAWPGNVGPIIESLAGKLDRTPALQLFQRIDQRGAGGTEDNELDRYVSHRQICAQLLKIFIDRSRDPAAFSSITPTKLDDLYQENTDLEPKGTTVEFFRELLTKTDSLVRRASSKKLQSQKQSKLRKLDVISAFIFMMDCNRNSGLRIDETALALMGNRLAENWDRPLVNKKSSGSGIKEWYEAWYKQVVIGAGILHLDEQRLFSEKMKSEIMERDANICAICRKIVNAADAEFDHHPIPHYLGGRTIVSNGRLVHKQCHARGRPKGDDEITIDDI